MKCPRCTHQNPSHVNYCGKCGRRMGILCLSCNTVNLPESNFCHQCGQFLPKPDDFFSDEKISAPRLPDAAKIAQPYPTTGERKYATILFSDLSGYTTLAQRIDPEKVKEIVARLFRETTKVVTKYEGFIEKYIGDAVMAVFGAIRAHEDDPIRAIQAAREIHEHVSVMSSDYEKQIGQHLAMHTGINTGLVVTGDVDFSTGTHGISGATLNVAARLCSLAKPGDILVSSETYHQTIGYFNFDSHDPVKLKGMEEPILVYKVISRIDQPKKIHRFHGLRADLIGRNPDLELLKEALDRVRGGKGSLVLLTGNAGTGKSRLLEEFKSTLSNEKINWREGQCYPYTRNFTYYPLIDLLSRYFGIEERDDPEIVRKKIESGLKFVEHRENVVPYVGSLYNLQYKQLKGISSEIWRSRLQKAILEILNVMAGKAPTIICLEDLHWADPSSLELIRFLLSDFRYPALVICLYRPTLTLLSNQQIASLGESHFEIRLEDLSAAETETMLGSLLKAEHIPSDLKRLVREKTGGNPFYLEEIINSFIESEILVPQENTWKLRKSVTCSDISTTIHNVIASRIDRLEADMKRILQEASVIGRYFYYEILSRINGFEENLWHHLSSLETLDLIKVRSYRPAVEYIFKHALTQEVVYSSLVKENRRRIHERVGLVMEKLFVDRLPEYYETLAYHFQRGRSVEKAIDYLVKSGQKSMKRYALEEAHRYFHDAYTILKKQSNKEQETDSLLIDLLNKWSNVYYYRGRFKELLSLLIDHISAAESLPDDEKRGWFYAWLGCALWHRERFKEAHHHLLTALALGEKNMAFSMVGYACCWLSWVCTELGLLDEAINYSEKAQGVFETDRRDGYIYVSSMAGMGYALWHRGEKTKTFNVGNALLDFGFKRDDYRAKGMGYCCIGWSHLIGGDLAQANPFFEKAVQVSVDPWYSLFPKLAMAYGLILNGNIYEAEKYISEILKFSQQFGAEFAGTPAKFFHGVVLVSLGHIKQGLKILEENYQQWRENGCKLRVSACGSMLATLFVDLFRRARSRHLSKYALHAGEKANEYFMDSIEVAKQISAVATLGQAYKNWAGFCEEIGDTKRAEKCAVEALAYVPKCESAVLPDKTDVDSVII